LTDPSDSILMASVNQAGGGIGRLFMHDNIIYTQLEEGGRETSLNLIDVSDPENPELLDQMYLPNFVNNIHFQDELAYFAVYPNILIVYNISDPNNPVYLCDYYSTGYIRDIAVFGDYIYVADGSSLLVLGLTQTGIEEVEHIPSEYFNIANYPNPFNSSTVISFTVEKPGLVKLDIYDILGRKIGTLLDSFQPAGEHSTIWQADSYSTGLYFYKLTAGECSESKKMLLVK